MIMTRYILCYFVRSVSIEGYLFVELLLEGREILLNGDFGARTFPLKLVAWWKVNKKQ